MCLKVWKSVLTLTFLIPYIWLSKRWFKFIVVHMYQGHYCMIPMFLKRRNFDGNCPKINFRSKFYQLPKWHKGGLFSRRVVPKCFIFQNLFRRYVDVCKTFKFSSFIFCNEHLIHSKHKVSSFYIFILCSWGIYFLLLYRLIDR